MEVNDQSLYRVHLLGFRTTNGQMVSDVLCLCLVRFMPVQYAGAYTLRRIRARSSASSSKQSAAATHWQCWILNAHCCYRARLT